MDVIGTVLSVAQTLFAALQSAELKEFLSVFGYKSQLQELQETVSFIQAVFQDAEKKVTLSAVELKLIEDLKDAVYEADDLLDEFVTLAEQKQLLKSDGSFSKKMRGFISRRNPFGVAYRMSQGVKKIKKKLDAIAYNKQFSFQHDPEPIRKRRPETCSYVDADGIIGREEDLEKIVGMLLDPNVRSNVSLLSIVGIGGLGKTALTQLVYNDPRINSAFPLKLWTCVSDQAQEKLDVKQVLDQILASATNGKRDEGSSLDQVQSQLRQRLAGTKYLLVLDDIWTEKREDWCNLAQYITGGQRGSWIVVTTRSQKTATILGDDQPYVLEGLSNENSWRLFERSAFGQDKPNPPQDLVDIGHGIVDKCARIPLAIRVVGSLLYGQDKQKWQSVHEIGIRNIRDNENGIMPILKLSYDHLESPLKSCFSYCALFPKDYRIPKDMLISLWMAQGYVVPFDKGQSVEDAGEEYFSILLRRCFFQDIQKDFRSEEISSVKIHDLMHDIAQSVSMKEICATSTIRGNVDNKKVYHVSYINTSELGNDILGQTHIRSLILIGNPYFYKTGVDQVVVGTLVKSCRCLRALDLYGSNFKCLPNSIGKLLHLRYLDLSYNKCLEVLPKTIDKLCNLQTLNLGGCDQLKVLPEDICKLTKLRTLDISYCSNLRYMPRGMDRLTGLYSLSDFKVGSGSSGSSWKHYLEGLQELKALRNLKGHLDISVQWPKNVEDMVEEDCWGKELYLKNKEHLSSLRYGFTYVEGIVDDEGTIRLMEDLDPPPNIMDLGVWNYPGSRIPDWLSLLSKLVKLDVSYCKKLEYIPCFENAQLSSLPLLEYLSLVDLPKLKGLRRGIVGVGDDHLSSSGNNKAQLQSCFPRLKKLHIFDCPEMTWFPWCPKLDYLNVKYSNKRMVFAGGAGAASTSCEEVWNSFPFPILKHVDIDNVKCLINSLPIEAFQCLERLVMFHDKEVEKLGEVGELFRSCSSSLTLLRISRCPKLRSVVGGGLEHLTALEELQLKECGMEEEEEDVGMDNNVMPSSSLLPSLRTLTLSDLPELPKWMQFLSALQTLKIFSCQELKAMPNWMPKLTTLTTLDVKECSKSLERRCQKDPQGEDWPFIQHISSIQFQYCNY